MMIKCNDRNWSTEEKEEILNEAVKDYLSKRRTTKISHINMDKGPPKKIRKVDSCRDDNDRSTISTSSSESDADSEDCVIVENDDNQSEISESD